MFFPAAAKGNLSTDTLFVGGRSKLLLRFLQLVSYSSLLVRFRTMFFPQRQKK
jgi:hypothetical protein